MGAGATFESIARRAGTAGLPISERTLRRALDGRLPTRRTVIAFARGCGACEHAAGQLWQHAAAASRPAPARTPRVSARFSQVTTAAGLRAAMERLRAAAGNPSLRTLAAAPEAGGHLSRSALHLMLAGKRLPSDRQLTAFSAACGADQATIASLLRALARVVAGPRPPAASLCDAAERADDRRQQVQAHCHWLVRPELDCYDQQLRDEEQAGVRAAVAWVDSLSAAELEALQQVRRADREGCGLHAELVARAARVHPAS
jgi:hypothetical protein